MTDQKTSGILLAFAKRRSPRRFAWPYVLAVMVLGTSVVLAAVVNWMHYVV